MLHRLAHPRVGVGVRGGLTAVHADGSDADVAKYTYTTGLVATATATDT